MVRGVRAVAEARGPLALPLADVSKNGRRITWVSYLTTASATSRLGLRNSAPQSGDRAGEECFWMLTRNCYRSDTFT